MRLLTYFFALLSMVMAFSCKPSVPDDYIQPGDMEDILYDYHIAMAMADVEAGHTAESQQVIQRAYKLAVLKEHGVTEALFDSSLKYYMRHTERIHGMYEDLSERLESESSAMGVSGDAGYRRIMTANGDSADIWTGDRALLLLADEPYNKSSFAFKADTAFHKGDRLQLSFRTQYIVQEGSRDAVVVLNVKFANDSIASQYQRVSSNMRQTISITDTKRVGIKEVKGYMMFSRGLSNPVSTLKLLFVTDIQLLRIHNKEAAAGAAKSDSLKVTTPSGQSLNGNATAGTSPAESSSGAANVRQSGNIEPAKVNAIPSASSSQNGPRRSAEVGLQRSLGPVKRLENGERHR